MLLLGSLLLPAAGILAAPRRAPAAAEVWCGQLDYGSFAKGAPINISFDASGATATVVLIYDVDAGHNKCSPDHEPGLKVTRNATYMTLAGTGARALCLPQWSPKIAHDCSLGQRRLAISRLQSGDLRNICAPQASASSSALGVLFALYWSLMRAIQFEIICGRLLFKFLLISI